MAASRAPKVIGLLVAAGLLAAGPSARAASIAVEATPTLDGLILLMTARGEGAKAMSYQLTVSFNAGVGFVMTAGQLAGCTGDTRCTASGGIFFPNPGPLPDTLHAVFFVTGLKAGDVIDVDYRELSWGGADVSTLETRFTVIPEPAPAILVWFGLIALTRAPRLR